MVLLISFASLREPLPRLLETIGAFLATNVYRIPKKMQAAAVVIACPRTAREGEPP